MLVIFTDGVTEAMNANYDLYSEQRLAELLRGRSLNSVEEAVELLLSDISDHVEDAEQSDDITALTLHYTGLPNQKASFSISVPNELSSIDLVNDKFQAFCAENDLSEDVVRRTSVVFDELLNNIVSYGFDDDGHHEIDVRVSFDGRRLVVEILDDGRPFNPFLQESPDTTLPLEEREVGGLGIHLVRKMMDEVAYERRINRNVVRLVKRFHEE
jgi:sigma-B regulation protein RsbU (phosphoserine phosphatase)